MDREPPDAGDHASTAGSEYTRRLQSLSSKRWKRLLDVQAPYRWNLRRLRLGRTLDVGCGIGRNLAHLGGDAVGVDHNAESIAVARSRGLEAYTVEQFQRSRFAAPDAFDSMLIAHVLEHMGADEAAAMIESYLPFLGPNGRICLITPQEAGYRSDATHVRFVDFAALAELLRRLSFDIERSYSFPLPRIVGRVFRYNEFVVVARRRS